MPDIAIYVCEDTKDVKIFPEIDASQNPYWVEIVTPKPQFYPNSEALPRVVHLEERLYRATNYWVEDELDLSDEETRSSFLETVQGEVKEALMSGLRLVYLDA